MKLEGRITISRVSAPDGDMMEIEIMDNKSRITFVQARMSMEDFAYALTSVAERTAQLEVYRMDLVGKRKEHKTEIVPTLLDRYSVPEKDLERVARKHLKQWEIDGWIGRTDDLFNMHRKRDGGIEVNFVRWVEDKNETV
jgi:hypothetical protein